MSVVVVSARVHADNVDAVAVEAQKAFAAITAAEPDVGYAICKRADGVTFVAILDLPGERNPLFAFSAFVEFQLGLRAWVAEPPTSEVWEVVGSYGLFGRAADTPGPHHPQPGSRQEPTKERTQ